MTDISVDVPQVPAESNEAVVAWMASQGWIVGLPRWEKDPETGFHVWQELEPSRGRSHALWVAEPMLRHLAAEELVRVLDIEGVAEAIRISFKARIEERGNEYRVSIVPRASGEWRRQQ